MPEIVGTLKPPRLAAAPSSPVKGQMYFNSTDNTLYWWDGTKWVASGGGSTPPEVYIGTAAPTRNQEVLWVDTDEAPPAVTRDINMDTWHVVGAAGEPAFQNTWTALSAPVAPRFRKFPDGKVRLTGQAKPGGAGTAIFVLPAGYRPSSNTIIPSVTNAVFTYITISTSGDVSPSTATTYVSLDGIEFDTQSVLQAASVTAQPMEPWHTVGAAGEPAFQNGFVNYDGTNTAGFKRYPDGKVRLKGIIKSGTNAQTAFTLPVGYRVPAGSFRFSCPSGAQVDITSAGGVNPTYTGWVDLSGVEFDTDTVTNYSTGAIIYGPQRVTVLPGSPSDGQEVYYVADTTNGILWHLRYNALAVGSYKWEFVGGPPLTHTVAASESRSSTTAGELTTPGPQVTVPLAGDYWCSWGGRVQAYTTGTIEGYIPLYAGAGGNTSTNMICVFISVGQYNGGSVANSVKATGNAAGDLIRLRYSSQTAVQWVFAQRWLEVLPVRVG